MRKIDKGPNSPEIILDTVENKLEIKGSSFLNNPHDVYSILFIDLEKNAPRADKEFNIMMMINYCGSSSVQILNKLVCLIAKKCNGKVNIEFNIDKEEEEEGLELAQEICLNSKLTPSIKFF
jgi:hypothetical protein